MNHHYIIMSENEYRGRILREQADQRRLAKEALANQRAGRQGRAPLGIGTLVQTLLVMIGR